MTHRILLLRCFDHHDGNGTTTFYQPGDTGEFPEPLANALVYEGMGVFAPDEGAPEETEPAEGDETEEKALDGAPENKAKKPKAK